MDKKTDTAIFAADAKCTDRLYEIDEHDYRSKFQRDRDRILYSKEFRRLSGKTQIFVSGFDDNIRTRLTHTLEVAQIANTICSALELNTELTEAIALGHDVGHTPFGHVGERVLNYVMNGCIPLYNYEKDLGIEERGFKHNLQGAKVVTKLGGDEDGEPGLNLTRFTIWGIVNHTKQEYKVCSYWRNGSDTKQCQYKNRAAKCTKGELSLDYYKSALKYKNEYILEDKRDWTFEALIVGIADEIAQRHHDIEDGIFAGIIDYLEIIEFFEEHFDLNEKETAMLDEAKKDERYGSKAVVTACISKIIINKYVTDAIHSIEDLLTKTKKELKINEHSDFNEKRDKVFEYLTTDPKGKETIPITEVIHFSNKLEEADRKLKSFLVGRILQSELAQSMDGKAEYIIRQLIKAYLTNPQQLPDATIVRLISEVGAKKNKYCLKKAKKDAAIAGEARCLLQEALVNDADTVRHILLRVVCDYIAGMTDKYAYKQYNKLYGTGMEN